MCQLTANASESAYRNAKRVDPTGTRSIRRSWIAELNRRWNRVKGKVYRAINNDDIFGLRDSPVILQDPPGPKAYQFKTDSEKVNGFMMWLEEMMDNDILDVQYNEEARILGGGEWQHTYIDSAYQKGMRDGDLALKKAGLIATDIVDPFDTIDVAFMRPVPANRVALLYTRSFRALKGITESTNQVLSRTLAQGLAEGRGPQAIARNISKNIKDIGMTRARALARTETIRAHHMGNIQMFREAGLEQVTVKAEWATAGAGTCFDCAWMNGRIFTLDEIESLIPLHVNCVAANTQVLAPGLSAGQVSTYSGVIVHITLADGTRLPVTPNHILLTANGFMAAKSLCKGDNVIYCPDFKGVVPGNPDDDGNPFRIDNVIKSLTETSGGSTMSMPVSPIDFHGDGEFCQGNIDIVSANSFLRDSINGMSREHLDQLGFNSRRWDALFGFGSFFEFLYWTGFASDSSMGGFRETLAAFNAFAAHSDDVCLTGCSEFDPVFFQNAVDWSSRCLKTLRQRLDAFSGFIELNEVVSVEFDSVVGFHVYDLHSLSTMYIANGVLSSNCRCVALPAGVGEDEDTRGGFDPDSVGQEYRRKDGSFRFRNFYKQKTGKDALPPRSLDRK